eukprot:Em0005g376a
MGPAVENVIGEVNRGVYVLMSGLGFEMAAGPVGIMQACVDVAFTYVHERKQFDQTIGTFQLLQGKMADMYTRLVPAAPMSTTLPGHVTRAMPIPWTCAGAILYAAESGTLVALDAIQCLGGNGYINDYPTGRFLRDAKLYEIGAGTSEMAHWQDN